MKKLKEKNTQISSNFGQHTHRTTLKIEITFLLRILIFEYFFRKLENQLDLLLLCCEEIANNATIDLSFDAKPWLSIPFHGFYRKCSHSNGDNLWL